MAAQVPERCEANATCAVVQLGRAIALYKSTRLNGSLRATTRMACTAEFLAWQRLSSPLRYLLISGSQVRILLHPPILS